VKGGSGVAWRGVVTAQPLSGCGLWQRDAVCASAVHECVTAPTLRLYAVEKLATIDMTEFLLKMPS